MLKSLVLIFCCMCVAIVLSELAGILLLWQRGFLTAHHFKEIRLILTNGVAAEVTEADAPKSAPLPSLQEVTQARAIKILDLEKRESELAALKNMAVEGAGSLDVQQKAFRAQRIAFEEELAKLEKQVTEAGTEQARGVLLALAPKDAVEKLMQLTAAEDVVLLKGMPEKSIAKILNEFKGSEEKVKRSREVFEAISRAAPTSTLLSGAKKKFSTTNDEPAN